jgi:hypothetical protein
MPLYPLGLGIRDIYIYPRNFRVWALGFRFLLLHKYVERFQNLI